MRDCETRVKKILYRLLQNGIMSFWWGLRLARALEFDYDKAIDKATRVFWKNGYSGTSLRDLLKAIGIGEGSFYNTLKSKKQLYLKCLKRYNNTVGRRRAEALFSPSSAKEGGRGLLTPCS